MRSSLAAAALVLVALACAPARADDYVTVRGAYYREASTRVIQPTVELERDTSLVDVKAHFLIDAITSASMAAGTAVDTIFTETRNEAGFLVRIHGRRGEMAGGYTYSAESDYESHNLGASVAGRFWGDTARVGLSLGLRLDTVAARGRTPECALPPDTTCPLHGYFAGLSYTQILSPEALVQLAGESMFLSGYQGNLYRSVPNFGFERLPSTRLRNAVSARVAYHVPSSDSTLRLQYRYYVDLQPGEQVSGDPWHLGSHMVEARFYQPLSDTLTARLSYRQYLQAQASFWCDPIASPGCYPPSANYYSTDPKLGRMHTEYPEIQLVWLADAFRDVPVLDWLSAGTFAISYGYYFQNTSFGGAHLLQTGYTLPY